MCGSYPCSDCGKPIEIGDVYYERNSYVRYCESCIMNHDSLDIVK